MLNSHAFDAVSGRNSVYFASKYTPATKMKAIARPKIGG
jgi:hypothetical protein